MQVFEVLDTNCVKVGLESRTKDGALRELVDLVGRSSQVSSGELDEIYEKLKKREEKGSTALGDGVAIPHSAVPGMKDFVMALAVSKRGIPFEALDKKKVHVLAVIVGPEGKPKEHIQLLAKLSHVFRSSEVRRRLINSPTSLGLYETFMSRCRAHETAGGDRSKKQKVVILQVQTRSLFDEIVEVLADLGVGGVSVMESTGMKRSFSRMPLFADFIHFFGDHSDDGHTIIFTVYEDNVDDVLTELEEVTGDLDTHSGAMMIVLEPWLIKGSLDLI